MSIRTIKDPTFNIYAKGGMLRIERTHQKK